MQIPTSSETESDVKSIIAWASISYAFGFATVTLHTSRLGLPVLEVLSAVYIWIGLPLALVAFFGRRLAQFFRARALARAIQLRTSWNDLTAHVNEKDLDVVATSFRVVVTFFPFFMVLENPLTWLIRRTNVSEHTGAKRVVLFLKRVAAVSTGVNAVIGIIQTIVIALGLIVALYVYVWYLYPRIPQTLGGGRPRPVQLLVISDKTIALAPYISNESNSPSSAASTHSALTIRLKLLYVTKDHYYLETESGVRFSLSSDSIEGVVWNPK